MMETLRIFIAMLIFAAFSNLEAAVSRFEDIDALSTESVKLRSKAAAEQRAWNSEKSEMLAELSALKEMRGALLEKISRAESEIAEANKQTEIIRRKLSKDESAMRDLDAFLSEKYEAWIETPRIADVLSKIGLGDRQKFAEKSVSEKLSAVCAILKAIKAEDFQIDKSESAISSGIFVRARGRVTDNAGTASLKVERGAKK